MAPDLDEAELYHRRHRHSAGYLQHHADPARFPAHCPAPRRGRGGLSDGVRAEQKARRGH